MATRSNPYGVTTALRSGTLKINPQLITDFNTLGLGWVRLMVLWQNIETFPGVYSATALDTIDDAVHRCNQAGLHVQFPIQQPPDFHKVSTDCCPSGCTTSGPWFMPNPASVGNFAAFLANRYNGITNVPGYGPLFIDTFEVGNEEYDNHFCHGCAVDVANQPCRTANWFIPCLQAAAPKIRANSPNALIGMAALWWEFTPHHQEFMNDLYATSGIKSLFDYANIHFYSHKVLADQNTDAQRLSLGGQVNEIYNIMAANGDGKKNVWVTEWGYTTQDMSDATRISYMNKFLDVARTNGHVGVVNYFTMNYVDPAINATVQTFSLTQFNSPHYTQSFTGYQNYITANPPSSWPSGGGSGGGGGGGGAGFALTPPTLAFTAAVGGTNPTSQALTLQNTGTVNGTWALAVSNGSWLSAGQTSGSLTAGNTVANTITAAIAGLTAGTYTADITITFTPTSGAVITATCAVTLTISAPSGHLFYVITAGTVYCYDMDASFTLKKQINVNQLSTGIRGCACDPAANALYLAYGGDGGGSNGGLLSYNLLNDTVNYAVNYNHGIDQLAISPDGSTIYMPEGELASGSLWHVVNAATGAETGTTISGGTGPHNTIVSLDGANVYLAPRFDTHLSVYNLAAKSIIKKAGPVSHGDGIRPFTINKAQTLAFITMSGFLGFDVWDISTNSPALLYTVAPPGFSGAGWGGTTPCHGISLSPDESEIYLVDAPNAVVHVFDVTGLPKTAPKDVADIALSRNFNHNEKPCPYDCAADGWVLHSLDGKYVFVGDEGDVIDTTTRKLVVNLDPLYNTRHGFLEVEFSGGKAIATSTHFGLGYGSTPFPSLSLTPTSLTFNASVGGGSPSPQTVVLTNTGPTTASWSSSIAYGSGASGWFSFTPTTGTLAAGSVAALPMTAALGTLPAGTYSATVTFSITTGGQTATATLTATFVVSPSTGNIVTANPGDNLTAKVNSLSPGDVLQLNDGTYSEGHGLTCSGVHGTPGAPITILALHDGKVTIDGSGSVNPVHITDSSWITIQGIHAQNSSGSVWRIDTSGGTAHCSNITLQRCTGTTAKAGNWHLFDVESGGGTTGPDHILIEDCAGWERGRYAFLAYRSSFVTFRRCFAHHNFQNQADFSNAPRVGFGCYGSHDCVYENCIARHIQPHSSDVDYYSATWMDCDDTTNFPVYNNHYYGCLFTDSCGGLQRVATAGSDNSCTWQDIYWNIPANSTCALNGDHNDTNMIDWNATGGGTWKNFTVVNSQNVFRRNNSTGSLTVTNSVFLNNGTVYVSNPPQTHQYNDYSSNSTIGITLDGTEVTTAPNYNTSTYGEGAYLMPPQNLVGHGQSGADMGSHIIYRYVNGTLTTTPLWPWPMESRVMTAIGQSPTFASNGGPFTTLSGIYGGGITCGAGATATLAEAGAVGVATGGHPVPNICIVALENYGYDASTGAKFVIGNPSFPNLNNYFKTYGAATKFYGLNHNSLPNYLGFASGVDHSNDSSVDNDSYNPATTPFSDTTLVESMANASPPITWKHYAENLPSTGYLGGDTGGYIQHHNPWVYFKGVRNSTALASHIVNYSSASIGLAADLAAGTAPSFFFVQPNNGDNGHTGTATACDDWVKKFVDMVQASTWYTQGHGNIVLWFDESNKGDTSGIGDDPNGGHIYFVVINAENSNKQVATSANTYGLLATIENLYGLPLLGNSAHAVNGDVSALLPAPSATTTTISVTPATLSFNGPAGGASSSPQPVTLANSNAGSTAAYTTASSQPWLTVGPTSGSIPAGGNITSTITATIGSLVAGTYTGTITYTGPTNSVIVTVTLKVTPVATGVTPLTAYLSGIADTLVTTANKVFIAGGGTTTTANSTLIGASVGYGELYSQGTTNTWAGASSEPAPSGHGWLLDSPVLEGNDLQAGAYIGTLTLSVGGVGAQAISADVLLRAYKRTSSGTYHQIADAPLAAHNICPASSTITLHLATTQPTSFVAGDKLYIDALLNILVNTGPSTTTVVASFLSTESSSLHGMSQASLATPGYAPTPGGPPPPTPSSLPGQFFANGVSNYLFGTNMSQDFAANTVRNTPAIQSQIKSGGFTVMRCAIPNGSTNAYIDLTANACIACGTAMLVILSSSDNTWNQHLVTYLGSRCNLYEVGNEPDISGVSVATYSANWNSFIPVLRGINPNAAFIGPALGVFANVNSYLVPWLQNCKTSGVLPSGVSYHVYPCTSGACDQTCCTPLSGNFQNDANTLKSAISGVFGTTLPICLTEWNIDASNPMKPYTRQNPFNNTWIGAAIDSMVAGKIDMACQWDAAGNAGGGSDDLISTQAPYPQQVEYAPIVAKITQYLNTPPACPPNCPPPGLTPLSVYGSTVAAPNLATADTLVTLTGTGTEATIGTTLGQATGYGELYSDGNNAAWPALSSIGSPSGNGWLLDEPILEGQAIQAGNWGTKVKLGLAGFASSNPPVSSPLTVYGTSAPSTTLSTAGTLVTQTGGTIGHSETQVGKAVRYGELYALGTTANWPALASMGAPTGHGFLWDVTTLEAQQIAAGAWTPTVRGYISTLGGSIKTDIYLNAYKRSSSGVYTTIGSFGLTGQTITRTSANYALAPQALAAVSFNIGDKLYVDVWLNITTNTANDSSMHVNLALSTTGSGGLANEVQVVTPGYGPQASPGPGGVITSDVLVRTYIYNSGTYTPITTFTAIAQTISGTLSIVLPPPASVGVTNFNSGDRLYVDLWLNVTGNALVSPGLIVTVALPTIAQGIASDLEINTPGYKLQAGVVVSMTPPSLTFSDSVGGIGPPAQTVLITNTHPVATAFDTHTSANWLLALPSSGTVPASGSTPLTVEVETGQLTAGVYSGTVSVLTSGGVADLAVTFTVLAVSSASCSHTANQWQCLLACQDITNYIDPTSIDISDTMGSQSATGSNIPIATRAGTIQINTSLGPMSKAIGRGSKPAPGRPQLVRLGEVIVYDNKGTTIFGGYATKYTDTSMQAPNIGRSLQPFTTINGIDYDASLDRVLVNETFSNQTDIQIIAFVFHKYVPWVDLSLLPTTPNYTYPTVSFTNVTVLGVLQSIQGVSGFLAWVDYNKKLHYVSPAKANSAPFSLSDHPDFAASFPHNVQEFITEDTAAINRVFFRGGRRISNDFKQDISVYANGTNTVFPLAYRGIHEASDGSYHVTVNGVSQVVGLVGSGGPRNTLKPDGLADVILDPDAGTLTFAVAPSIGASVFSVYRFNFPLIVVATDEKSHAFFGDPYMDGVINDTNVFDTTTALQRCRVLLSQQSFGLTTLKVDTWTAGLQSGQTIHITNKVREIDDIYLIQEVETEWYAATGSKPGGFVYHVTAGAWNWNIIDVVVRLAASASSAPATANAGAEDTVEQVLPIYAALALSTSWSVSTTTTVPHIPPYYARATALGDGHDAFPGFSTCGG